MRLNVNLQMKELLTKDESFWVELLKTYLINVSPICCFTLFKSFIQTIHFFHFQAKRISIRAVPSTEEQKRMAKEEAERVLEQRKTLGEIGLKKKGDELSKAISLNEIPPPAEMLTKVPIPNVTNINSLPSKIQQRGGDTFGDSPKLRDLNLDEFPIPVNVTACSIDSNFGYVSR